MDDFQRHLDEQLKDPEFRAEYEKSRIEYQITRALIEARVNQNITQGQLAARCGMRQSNISRIENGTCSPTIATLQQLADGLGKKLKIEFL